MKRQNRPVAEIAKLPPPVGRSPTPRLVAEVRPQDGDIIFEKFTPNAFLGTSFEWWLKKYGIAPPQAASSRRALFGAQQVECPQCGSADTELLSEFGSTSCKALWRCKSCREPFDYFKCH